MKGNWTSMIVEHWRDQYALGHVRAREVSFQNFDGTQHGFDMPREVWDALGQPRYLVVGDDPDLITFEEEE